MLLTVNYHYVGMPVYPYDGIHGLAVDEFIQHILWLKKNFRLISLQDLLLNLDKGYSENVCLITFDDGFRCNSEIVAPLMEKYDFPAIFFVSTNPLIEHKAIDDHKSQYVRAHFSNDLLFERLKEVIEKEELSIDLSEKSFDAQVREHYRYDEFEVGRVKYLLNYVLSSDVKKKIISSLFIEKVKDEKEFCRQWYMDIEEIQKLNNKFNCIGSHTCRHLPVATLSEDECNAELKDSKKLLEDILGNEISSFSYPLGNEDSVILRDAEIAEKAGYRLAFTMERAGNFDLTQPLLLARLDCNDLPVGKRPAFEIKDGNICGLNDRNRFRTKKA